MTEQEKDRLCRQIVEGIGDAVIFSDSGGVIRFWNRGAEAVFGYSEAEAVGQTLNIIIPEKQREAHWKGYGKSMREGTTKYGRQTLAVPAVRKDGTRISIEFTIALLRGEDGNVLGPAAVVRDVSERWEREKSLRQRISSLEGGKAPDSPRTGK